MMCRLGYSILPVSVFLVLGDTVDRDFHYTSTPLSIYIAKGSGQSVVQVVEGVEWGRDEDSLNFTIDGIVYKGNKLIKTTVENLLMSTWGLHYDRFRGMSLRMLVYSTLRHEISAVEDAFRNHVKNTIE